MITYRYGPYEPEDDGPWNMDRLMSVLSEMLMRYDMQLDDALKELLNRGMPVNLFLKEGGMDDLVQSFLDQLQEQIDSALDQYQLNDALNETRQAMEASKKTITNNLKDPQMKEQFNSAADSASTDGLMRLKWALQKGLRTKEAATVQVYLRGVEDYNRIEEGMRKYKFRGKTGLSRKEAIELLDQLDEIENLRQNMQQSLNNGDLMNFNLERLAKYLGQESYEEFLERREAIYEKLRELMEKQGQVVRDEESGEMKLSPKSVKRIGRRALEEIFKTLKEDSSGGHSLNEEGDSDQFTANTRQLEYGDTISSIDVSASVVNALIRSGQTRPNFRDIEIFKSRAQAKSATVVLIDMSGSMMRSDRFFFAKRMVMALDALIREDYADDKLMIVGFGTLAKSYSPSQIPSLQPFPVTMYDPHIRLRLDMARHDENSVPLYFTNLQRGLQLSRTLLGSGETQNKQIILITDGVPTAHMEGRQLHINYPPSPADFEFALRETQHCNEEDITINTFLLTSDWDMAYFGDESFIQQFAKSAGGRIFYPHPNQLDKMVLVDFVQGKKMMI